MSLSGRSAQAWLPPRIRRVPRHAEVYLSGHCQAQEVHAAIRANLRKAHGDGIGNSTRIIYGGQCRLTCSCAYAHSGSVKPDNVDSLFAKADVDGFLVGGASLIAADFLRIINAKSSKSA